MTEWQEDNCLVCNKGEDFFICECGNVTFSFINGIFRCGECKCEYAANKDGNLEVMK